MHMRKGLVWLRVAFAPIAVVALVLVMLLPAPAFSQDQELPATTQVGVPRGAPQAARPAPPKPPSKPTQRWPDGKPIIGRAPGENVTGGPAAATCRMPTRRSNRGRRRCSPTGTTTSSSPHTRCHPSGGSRQFVTPYGSRARGVPGTQGNHDFRYRGTPHVQDHLSGRATHPANLKPSYYGHSIGHWEGDTLVVDTVGFNEEVWMDRRGSPHTEKLRFVERFTRTDHDTMKYK